MNTIRSIFKSIDKYLPFKETLVTLLITFVLLIIIEAVWKGSVSQHLNVKLVTVTAVVLGYIALCIILVKYIRRNRDISLKNVRKPGTPDYKTAKTNRLIKTPPVLLLLLPIVILLLIAIDNVWEGIITSHVNIDYLIAAVIISEFLALFIVFLMLCKSGGHRILPGIEKKSEPAPVIPDSGKKDAETAAQAGESGAPAPVAQPPAPPVKAEKAAGAKKPEPALSEGQTIGGFEKTGRLIRIVRKTLALLSYLFPWLLSFYLLMLLTDTIWEESISSVLNLNYLLIAVIAVGIPAVLTASGKPVKRVKKPFGFKDIFMIGCAGNAGLVIVWYKTRDIGWPSYLMAIISCALIILLSLLILKEGDGGEDKEDK